jgi:RES domain-containing protein
MITSFRIANKKFAQTAFNGDGARQYGGRWNPVGFATVYTAESLSLAVLEILVHLEDEALLFQRFIKIPVTFDPALVQTLPNKSLPDDWDNLPIPESTQKIGKKWIQKGEYAILKVPSTIIKEEYNYLINPLHPDVSHLKIGPPQQFDFDHRLAKRLYSNQNF